MRAAHQIVVVCTEIRVQVVDSNKEDIWWIRLLRTRRSKQPEDKHNRRRKQAVHAVIAMSRLAAHIRSQNLVMFVRFGGG